MTEISRTTEILFPHFIRQLNAVESGQQRLAHYTSAANALKIISSRRLWLRDASLMNDYSELEHGFECLRRAWNSKGARPFRSWLVKRQPSVDEKLHSLLSGSASALKAPVYISSFSEHGKHEDQFGRLSMWRAYGGKAGVAIVIGGSFLKVPVTLGAFSTPVLYKTVDEFTTFFAEWGSGVAAAGDELDTSSQSDLEAGFGMIFRTFVLATKHPGFLEEREWRVFHAPDMFAASRQIDLEVEPVHDVPQVVAKVHLEHDATVPAGPLALRNLMDRIIIGPCESPEPIRAALQRALELSKSPDTPIYSSHIPLRQQR